MCRIGYGFVEFDNPEAAIESVNKYHEGYFMGNKIRVEISKGGSKSRHAMDPGSCFRCGVPGHWARCVQPCCAGAASHPSFPESALHIPAREYRASHLLNHPSYRSSGRLVVESILSIALGIVTRATAIIPLPLLVNTVAR